MGQVRSTLRALAPLIADPATLLQRLDDDVRHIEGALWTSVFVAVLDPVTAALRYCCAGHPPPLVVPLTGEPRFLDDGLGPLLGIDWIGPRSTATTTLGADDTLVLYTDGLVERRGQSLTDGLAELAEHARAGVQDGDRRAGARPAAVRDHLIGYLLGHDATDDTALLVARRPAPPDAG